ncbi:MAG TPA: trypsin [Firmicutes bacterium]|nr:trypsin [Bacillota bacterium]
MNKVLYTSLVVLVTAWSVFFIANFYHDKVGETTTPGVVQNEDGTIIQEVVEREVVTLEDQRIEAIEKVQDAIVGVVNFYQNRTVGEGSGIIYKSEGDYAYIVTNQHVIDQGDYFEVVLSNGERTEAELIGSDIYTDLAVLKIPNEHVEAVANFGNTEDLKLGQTVLAIGNPLGLEFAGSVTQGIVSGQDRTMSVDLDGNGYDDWEVTVLQTDTAINPGNSGGALIDLSGNVIGINSMKLASSTIEGMSFAIPTYVALPIIADLEQYGEVKRPQIGVYIQDMTLIPDRLKEILQISTELKTGVFIYEVFEDSIAANAGIKAGDVVTAIDGTEITDTMTFRQKLYEYREGQSIEITIVRENEEIKLTVQL